MAATTTSCSLRASIFYHTYQVFYSRVCCEEGALSISAIQPVADQRFTCPSRLATRSSWFAAIRSVRPSCQHTHVPSPRDQFPRVPQPACRGLGMHSRDPLRHALRQPRPLGMSPATLSPCLKAEVLLVKLGSLLWRKIQAGCL